MPEIPLNLSPKAKVVHLIVVFVYAQYTYNVRYWANFRTSSYIVQLHAYLYWVATCALGELGRINTELAKFWTICTFHGKFGRIPVTVFAVENDIFGVEIAIFMAEMD